jgi:outer membrane protein OmpA-like peptidoglycan-associated protein
VQEKKTEVVPTPSVANVVAPAPKAAEVKPEIKAEPVKVAAPVAQAKVEAVKPPEVKPMSPAQQAPEVTVSASAKAASLAAQVDAPKAEVAKVSPVETKPEAAASVAAPDPAKAVEPKQDNTQTTSLASVETPVATPKSSSVSFSFVEGKSELSKEAQSQLDSVAATLKGTQNGRVNVKAYASAGGVKEGDSEVMAKRISLARGLAIRAYLIDRGVSALRINVQPLGSKNNGGNPERVDVEMLTPAGS